MLLDGDPQPRRTERAEPHLDVPAVGSRRRARRSCTARGGHAPARAADRSGIASCSLQTVRRRGHGKANASFPRRRHGVSPPRSRPLRRAMGWSRNSTAVSPRTREPLAGSGARSAPCAANGLDGKGERGGAEEQQLDPHRRAGASRRNERPRKMPTTDSSASRPIRRYHSGISGSAPSVLGVPVVERLEEAAAPACRSRCRLRRRPRRGAAAVQPPRPGEMAAAVVLAPATSARAAPPPCRTRAAA